MSTDLFNGACPEPNSIEAIATAIAARIRVPVTSQVFTGDEAATYVKCPSYRAFVQWARRWKVPSCGQKRYARVQLDMGLDRESRHQRPSSGKKGH